VGTAYLFTGPRGAGKETLALDFAALLNCKNPGDIPCGNCSSCLRFRLLQHENLKLVVPLPVHAKRGSKNSDPLEALDKNDLKNLETALQAKARDRFYKIQLPGANTIPINAIRDLRKTLMLRSLEKGRKVVVFFDAHLLSTQQGESANALLKLLEEPPSGTTLILVTDHRWEILPTVLSRCQIVDFPPLKEIIIRNYLEGCGIKPEDAQLIATLAEGDLHLARKLMVRSAKEIYSLIKTLVQQVTTEDASVWRTFIDYYARLATSDPEEFRFHIYLLQLWLKEAFALKKGLVAQLHLSTLQQDLEQFNKTFPQADLHRMNLILEELLESLAKKLYLPLTLTTVLIDLQSHLVATSSK
jgi:DNA polymerase-3 subunit delta'